MPAARILIRTGKKDRARSLHSTLAQMIPPLPRSYAHLIAADIALSEGHVPEAIDELRAGQKLHDSWFGTRNSSARPTSLRNVSPKRWTSGTSA